MTKFKSAKLLLGVLRQEPSFVPDPKGEYYFVGGGTAGGYGLHLQDEYSNGNDDLLYFTAILNSRVLEFYHKHISFIFNSKYYSYGRTFLETHPVMNPEDALKDRIVERTEQLNDDYDEIATLELRSSDIRNYLHENCDSTVLDLAQSIELSGDDYRQDPIRTNDEAEANYQVVMKRGHTIDFEDESIRDFVYELLTAQDKRLGRSEILNTETPTKDGVLALMDEYDTDKRRIEELEKEAEEKQSELDNVILREVYGIDDEGEKVINEFLSTW